MNRQNLAAGLELRDITKIYQSRSRQVQAVKTMNLTIAPGDFVTLLGPSGCGKTTTLRMIAGFEKPTDGQILIDGENIVDLPAHMRPMSMVFQSYALFPHLSVKDNIAFGLKEKKVNRAQIASRIAAVMEAMHIEQYASRSPHELSGGQQQRVALARALVMEPKVLLFDEPLSNLDARLREDMRYEIRRIQQEFSITSIFVTHDQDEAMTMSDVIVVMSEGVVEQVGSPREVYQRPRNRFVAEFLGTANLLPTQIVNLNSDGTAIVTNPIGGEQISIRRSAEISSPRSAGLLVCRQEDIELADEPADGKITIPAEIESVTFHGDSLRYRLRALGQSITARTSGHDMSRPIGSSVMARIDPSHLWLISDSSQ